MEKKRKFFFQQSLLTNALADVTEVSLGFYGLFSKNEMPQCSREGQRDETAA